MDHCTPAPPPTPKPIRGSARGPRPYVLVYFGDNSGIPYTPDAASVLSKDPQWMELTRLFGPLRLLPAFRDVARMRRVIDRATENAKQRGIEGYRPLAFDHYFVVPLPVAAKRPVFDLYCGLKKFVETRRGYAWFAMPNRPPMGSDRYLEPGHTTPGQVSGIGAIALKGPGGGAIEGNGQRLVCVEKGWLYPDLDTVAPPIANLPAQLVDSVQDDDLGHGAAVLSIVLGGAGVTDLAGAAPGAKVTRAPFLDNSGVDFVPDTLYAAADALHNTGGAGGVILLEAQTWDGMPIESDPFTLKAIEDAELDGHIVIEPAGNRALDADGVGGVDLGGVTGYRLDQSGGADVLIERALDGSRRSPAIVVAAGGSGLGKTAAGQRIAESNYGAIVDAWAWGDMIRSLWYRIDPVTGDRVPVEHPTGFTGTSGAAAIVASAVVLMQAVRADAGRALLSTAEVRKLLADYGTPAQGDLAGKRMPDLQAMQGDLQGAID